jgi:non-ribosomal peptide synthetase component F
MSDALSDAVRALGGAKVVGSQLWPEMSVESAHRKLLDMLSPNRAEKFSPDQVVWLLRSARLAGYHGAMQWLCSETGYECKPLDPAIERDRLADAIEQASVTLSALLKAAERAASR